MDVLWEEIWIKSSFILLFNYLEHRLANDVTIGERSVIHTATSLPTGLPAEVNIGNFVVI